MPPPELVVGVGLVVTLAAAVVYRFWWTESVPSKTKLAKYSNRCKFCNRKTLDIEGTCSESKRVYGCPVAEHHSHIKCKRCEAEYLMEPKPMPTWYEQL